MLKEGCPKIENPEFDIYDVPAKINQFVWEVDKSDSSASLDILTETIYYNSCDLDGPNIYEFVDSSG